MRDPGYRPLGITARLLNLARPYWPQLGGAVLLSLVGPPLGLLAPLPLAIVIDCVLGDKAPPLWLAAVAPPAWIQSKDAILLAALGLLASATILNYLQGLAVWVLFTSISERLILLFRAKMFSHAQRLSLAFHDTRGVADSIYRIQYDAGSIQWILMRGGIPILSAFAALAGMILLTSWLDPALAAVALSMAVPLYWLTDHFGKKLRRGWDEVKDLDGAALGVVNEVLSALRVVKAFGQEEREKRRFLRHSEARIGGQVDLARKEGLLDLSVGLALAAGTAGALYLGVLHVRDGKLTAGGLVLVMTYLAQLYEPLKSISKRLADLQNGFSSAERALRLLDEQAEVKEDPKPLPLRRCRGELELRGVEFGYSPERRVLQGVDVRIPAGSRVGVTGRTGSGKTTLVSLLLRLYDPAAGQILLDGTDIRRYRLANLRDNYALVLQEPVLFSTTLAENIAYGRPGASLREIEEAARLANAHDFISALPEGYQTQAGERGMKLSGGERQRISLARAFLKDAPILVLDEPTSSVDTQTEGLILEAMERLMRGRTTIMIAHRVSTLESCTLRLHVEDGWVGVLEGEYAAATGEDGPGKGQP